jgi:hypothetical protein
MRDVYRECFQGGVVNYQKRDLQWFAGLFIPVIMLSACAVNNVSLPPFTPLTPDSMVIFPTMTRNYTGMHGVLNIYVDSNVFANALTRTPPSGQEDIGLTATLWLVITDRPETYTSFQVQSGQTISFEGYDIRILRIAEYDRGAYFVEVEVSEAE